MTQEEFQILANDFLVETEKNDETKPSWETKNHVSVLHNSLNEFYNWLTKNYWK